MKIYHVVDLEDSILSKWIYYTTWKNDLHIQCSPYQITNNIFQFVWKYSGFSNTWTMNFLMFKLVLEKAEEPEFKLPTSAGSLKKQESSRKTSISALLTMPKPLNVWITINCGKFWKNFAEELMLLNCGVGEDSCESLGLQGDPISPF